ncbi:MAG: sigma factor-like helix-turn-helix DNA-binding protein [Minisyncoccia bacterium]
MAKLNLKEPQALALSLLEVLPERNQDILKRRYGIINDHPQTLEAIGESYHITRERVRQIVGASLKILVNSSRYNSLQAFWSQARILLDKLGGIEEEKEFLNLLKEDLELTQSNLSTVKFLLLLNPDFCLKDEDDKTVSYWHLNSISLSDIKNNIKKIEDYFKKKSSVAPLPEILVWVKSNLSKEFDEKSLAIYLKIIKSIGKNPFGEYGLRSWAKIEPSGAKDRAYLLMSHQKQPLHFREIAKYLNENKEITDSPLVLSRSWFKKVEIQTIHNELIKDNRFVLIGRGIYALKDWGYKPGKVVDVIKDVLKEAKKPLTQEEIIKEVQKRRLAKINTIVLNLHNNKLFKKLDDKRYTLAGSYKILEG